MSERGRQEPSINHAEKLKTMVTLIDHWDQRLLLLSRARLRESVRCSYRRAALRLPTWFKGLVIWQLHANLERLRPRQQGKCNTYQVLDFPPASRPKCRCSNTVALTRFRARTHLLPFHILKRKLFPAVYTCTAKVPILTWTGSAAA